MRLLHRLGVLTAAPGSAPSDFGFDTIQVRWVPGKEEEIYPWVDQQEDTMRLLLAFAPPMAGPPFTQAPHFTWYHEIRAGAYRLREKYGSRLTGVRWNHEYPPRLFSGWPAVLPSFIWRRLAVRREKQVVRQLGRHLKLVNLPLILYPAGRVTHHSPRQLPKEEYSIPDGKIDNVIREGAVWHSRSFLWLQELWIDIGRCHPQRMLTLQLDRRSLKKRGVAHFRSATQAARHLSPDLLGFWSEWTPGKDTPPATIRKCLEIWRDETC